MARPSPSPWIDITMEFGSPAGTWPGDAPFSTDWTGRIGDGRWAVNLSRFCSSPHNGTHSDAPLHVLPDGEASETLNVDAYLGPCRVVDATKVAGSSLPESLANPATLADETRILFRTRSRPGGAEFPRHFSGISDSLARRLAASRIRLVGTDAPSVDAYDAKDLVAHRTLFEAGCTIIENLDLAAVKPGKYELVALPLKVRGLCAAPVRALLRPRSGRVDSALL